MVQALFLFIVERRGGPRRGEGEGRPDHGVLLVFLAVLRSEPAALENHCEFLQTKIAVINDVKYGCFSCRLSQRKGCPATW